MIERILSWLAPAPLESPGHRHARESFELRAAQLDNARRIRARHSLAGIRP